MKPLPSPAKRPDGAGAGSAGANVREADEPPIVVIRTVASRQEIVAASTAALGFGIRPGLTLTEARAFVRAGCGVRSRPAPRRAGARSAGAVDGPVHAVRVVAGGDV
jgi:hypothetical protein